MVLKLKVGMLVAATIASVTAGALVGQPAFASSPGHIVNDGSGLCLEPVPVAGQNVGDSGVRIAQEPCDPTNLDRAQQWQAVVVGGSGDQTLYYLVNQYDTNNQECLDVTDANPNDRAPIQQYACNGGGSEKWKRVSYSFGRYQYVNSRTSKCLDIPSASPSPEYIWQYHCTSLNLAQAFTWPS